MEQMSNKRALGIAMKGIGKVIEDLRASITSGQPIQADLAVLLIEELSGIADALSAYQAEIAAEAYLGTTRKPISVRKRKK
jgi:hypothetical protein